ncbi:MAG TPA: YCF48-related protein [Blastocatellia bacterium]|nr:YCF48-related protein [Blastocatellia bacterium]
MTSSRNIALSMLVALFVAGSIASVEAQQGWSQVQTIKLGDSPATVNAVFFDGDRVWVVGADGLISRSYDDGRTFHEINLGLDAGLNDVFVRKDRIWMVGDAGTIVLSTDGGRSFIKSLYDSNQRGRASSASPSPLDLYSVQFVDEDKGFIVGDAGLILSSEDGGISWREMNGGTDAQLFHLSFIGKRGWVVGTGGVILHTINGGRNWYPQVSGTKDDLNRVYLVTDRTAIITGDNGLLLRTDNGGATWEKIQLRTTDPLFGISFIDKNTGWVVGHNGRIIRTYDGGRHWIEQESTTGIDLFAVSFHKNKGYAIGRDGVVMRYYEKR